MYGCSLIKQKYENKYFTLFAHMFDEFLCQSQCLTLPSNTELESQMEFIQIELLK